MILSVSLRLMTEITWALENRRIFNGRSLLQALLPLCDLRSALRELLRTVEKVLKPVL
jgi:hypothetical protein